MSKSITSKFVSTSALSGTRAGEVQWSAGRVCGPAEDPPKAEEEPAYQSKAAQTQEVRQSPCLKVEDVDDITTWTHPILVVINGVYTQLTQTFVL